MNKQVALMTMVAVGGVIGIQAPINAGLGRTTGGIGATVINFIVGGLLVAAIMGLSGGASGLREVADVRWYYLLGGVCGAAYVFATMSLVGSIGARGIAAATITGQMVLSLLLDRIGAFGLESAELTGGGWPEPCCC